MESTSLHRAKFAQINRFLFIIQSGSSFFDTKGLFLSSVRFLHKNENKNLGNP